MRLIQESKLDSILNAYKTFRAEKIRSYVKNEADTTRIEVIISNPKSPKNMGSLPVFEVKYGMVRE